MTDLVAWLRQQLDTDERAARAVRPPGHVFDMGGNRLDERFAHRRVRYFGEDGAQRIDSDSEATEHFARYGPARVLSQVQAHRAILDEHEALANGACNTCSEGMYSGEHQTFPCKTIKALA
mgnify:CR=1 FL=1